jgi:hypothetical protein
VLVHEFGDAVGGLAVREVADAVKHDSSVAAGEPLLEPSDEAGASQ